MMSRVSRSPSSYFTIHFESKWFTTCWRLCKTHSARHSFVDVLLNAFKGSEAFLLCDMLPLYNSIEWNTKESNGSKHSWSVRCVFTCRNLWNYFWMNWFWCSLERNFLKMFTFSLTQIANNPCANLLTAHFRLDGHPNVNYLEKVIQNTAQSYLFFEPSQVVDAMMRLRN